jgi:hypothetical protein
MAYTDAEVEEVRIVMTIYTDARLAGKKGRHSKAKEPMDFLPQRKKRKGRDRKGSSKSGPAKKQKQQVVRKGDHVLRRAV